MIEPRPSADAVPSDADGVLIVGDVPDAEPDVRPMRVGDRSPWRYAMPVLPDVEPVA